jgi:hypothetical protein
MRVNYIGKSSHRRRLDFSFANKILICDFTDQTFRAAKDFFAGIPAIANGDIL